MTRARGDALGTIADCKWTVFERICARTPGRPILRRLLRHRWASPATETGTSVYLSTSMCSVVRSCKQEEMYCRRWPSAARLHLAYRASRQRLNRKTSLLINKSTKGTAEASISGSLVRSRNLVHPLRQPSGKTRARLRPGCPAPDESMSCGADKPAEIRLTSTPSSNLRPP